MRGEGQGQEVGFHLGQSLDCPLRAQIGKLFPRQNTRMGIGRNRRRTALPTTTTMASSLARIHWVRKAPTYSVFLSYSCRRRAMMSAWSSRSATATQTVPNPQQPLHDTSPIVIPTSSAPLSPDAASPQIAARPPPAPKMTRLKPTLRAQKAALTLVSTTPSNHALYPSVSDYTFLGCSAFDV